MATFDVRPATREALTEVAAHMPPGPMTPSPDYLEAYLRYPARVGFVQGCPVCAFGMVIPWPGYGQVWSLITDAAKRYPVWVSRAVLSSLRQTIAEYGLRRVEATTALEDAITPVWLSKMGFEDDGIAWYLGADGSHHRRFVLYPQGKP